MGRGFRFVYWQRSPMSKSAPKGYSPSKEILNYINTIKEPSLVTNFFLVSLDYLAIFGPAIVFFSITTYWKILLIPLIVVASARGLRGLECMVHDGSHYNFMPVKTSNRRRRISDLCVNLLAGFPTFSTVENYRASHSMHHRFLGTEDDPDYIRHIKLELDGFDRERPIVFISKMIPKMHIYWRSWWQAIGTDWGTSAKAVMWHTAFGFILSLLFGPIIAFGVWCVGFLLPFITSHPILRFVGEAAEHDFEQGDSVASRTYSNTGTLHRLLIHPHNDGYHTLHHLFPQVPHHNLRKLEAFIIKHDWDTYSSILKNRTRIFENA